MHFCFSGGSRRRQAATLSIINSEERWQPVAMVTTGKNGKKVERNARVCLSVVNVCGMNVCVCL